MVNGRAGPARPLGRIERAVLLTDRAQPLNLVALVRLSGPPLDQVLPEALATLQRRHLILQAGVRSSAGWHRRARFEIDGAGPIPLRTVDRVADDTWLSECERELNERVALVPGPLLRTVYVRGSSPAAELLITIHHCLTDGVGTMAVIDQLVENCRLLVDGQSIPNEQVLGMPPSAESRFPAGHRRLLGLMRSMRCGVREGAAEFSSRIAAKATQRPLPSPDSRCSVHTLRFNRDQTSVIVGQARDHKVSLTGLLSGALLWQVNKSLYHGALPVGRGLTFANLRSQLEPRIPRTWLGCYMTLLRYPVVLGSDRPYWEVVAEADRALRRVLRGGDAFALSRLGPSMVRASQRWAVAPMASVAVSYSPVRGVGTTYGPIHIHEVSAAITNNNVGAELALAASIFDGQLFCNLLYLEANWSRLVVSDVANDLVRLLTGST